MDNQPAPELIACMNCKFSRLVRPAPTSLDRMRVCFFVPPTPIMAITREGPTLLPSTHPPVLNQDWCAQFKSRPAGEPEDHESAPRVCSDDVPKLLM